MHQSCYLINKITQIDGQILLSDSSLASCKDYHCTFSVSLYQKKFSLFLAFITFRFTFSV